MKFIISHSNSNKDGIKQEKNKLDLLAMIKTCLCLIFIDRFLISYNVYCAESSDFDLIEKENRSILFQDPIETINVMTDNLLLDSKSTNDESESKLKDEEVPSTVESENSSFNTDLLEFRMLRLQCNLDSIQDYTIPDVIKGFDEDNGLDNKVLALIEDIKGKVKSYDESLIGKIEERMKTKQSLISEFNKHIQDVKTEIETLQLFLGKFKKIFYNLTTKHSSPTEHIFDKYLDSRLSKIDLQSKILLNSLVFRKFCFSKNKNEDNTILIILTKILELTPEEFKKDKEVLAAIISLKFN